MMVQCSTGQKIWDLTKLCTVYFTRKPYTMYINTGNLSIYQKVAKSQHLGTSVKILSS